MAVHSSDTGAPVQTREGFGSRFGFMMTTAGFAVGLGAIWRFPYLVSDNGGGAFVLVYLAVTVIVGVPLFVAELTLGRKTRTGAILGMRALTPNSPRSPFRLIGWAGAIASLCIMSYYVVILALMLIYAGKAFLGHFAADTTRPEIAEQYVDASSNTWLIAIMTLAVLLVTGIVNSRGIKAGLERVTKYLMPILIILLLSLVINSLLLPGAWEGVRWYLTPDLSLITGEAILAALGQAFFAIGIGCATAFLYGSYLDEHKSRVPGDALAIVLINTGIALLAGLMIFPAMASYDLDEASGPGLVFQTMPVVFTNIPLGNVAAIFFFVLVAIAGFTSAFGYAEGIATTIGEARGISRKTATWRTLAAIAVLSIPSILSYGGNGPLSHVLIGGRTLFDFADWIAGAILMPVGALLIIVYTTYVFGYEKFATEANRGAGAFRVNALWKPAMYAVIPLSILIIMITGLI